MESGNVWLVRGVEKRSLEREIVAEWNALRDKKNTQLREDATGEGIDLKAIDAIEEFPFSFGDGDHLVGELAPVVVTIIINVASTVAAAAILKAAELAWKRVVSPAVNKAGRSITTKPNPNAQVAAEPSDAAAAAATGSGDKAQ